MDPDYLFDMLQAELNDPDRQAEVDPFFDAMAAIQGEQR